MRGGARGASLVADGCRNGPPERLLRERPGRAAVDSAAEAYRPCLRKCNPAVGMGCDGTCFDYGSLLRAAIQAHQRRSPLPPSETIRSSRRVRLSREAPGWRVPRVARNWLNGPSRKAVGHVWPGVRVFQIRAVGTHWGIVVGVGLPSSCLRVGTGGHRGSLPREPPFRSTVVARNRGHD